MSFKVASSFSYSSAIRLQLIRHQRILHIILATSPKQLQAHIKACVINNNNLIIYVSVAAWASQLRFYTSQIQQAVNTQSNERIDQTQVKILSPEPFNMREQATKIFPSVKNINLLRKNADSQAEGRLKEALLSLSQTLKKT